MDSQREPLLVHSEESDEENYGTGLGGTNNERDNIDKKDIMASKDFETKTTAVEARERGFGNAETYRKTADDSGVVGGSGSMEMVGERILSRGNDEVDPEVLQHAIEVLEKKKTTWYGYMTTWDFWLVLLIGYAFFSLFQFLGFLF